MIIERKKDIRFRITDGVYTVMMILPLVCAMVIKVLVKPLSSGIEISGAQIYFTVPMPIQDLPITESQVNSWLVMITILGACLYLTHGITARVITKRQAAAEWIVETTRNMIRSNMGDDQSFGSRLLSRRLWRFPHFQALLLFLDCIRLHRISMWLQAGRYSYLFL